MTRRNKLLAAAAAVVVVYCATRKTANGVAVPTVLYDERTGTCSTIVDGEAVYFACKSLADGEAFAHAQGYL